MTPKNGALIGIFATSAVGGIASPWVAYAGQRHVLPFIAFLAVEMFLAGLFAFAWFIHDRRERRLPRSRWFNVCLVAGMPLVGPIYLWRTRPAGKRALALLGAFGVAISLIALAVTMKADA